MVRNAEPAADPGRWCWTHVTQPLSTDGSALNNVVRELSREASSQGICSAVAASDNRAYRFPDARILPVDFMEYLPREYLLGREKVADALTGRLGLGRRAVDRLYRPVAEALDATDGPIIVHDGFFGAAGLVAIERRHPHRPLFLYVHNDLSRSYSMAELRRFLARAEAVVCVSGAVRDAVAERVGRHHVRNKLVVVLNGVDPTRFFPADPEPSGVPAILFIGMMAEFKGPHVLMAALRRLENRQLRFTATFVGSFTHAEGLELTSYENALRRDQREIGPHVRFRSFVANTEVPAIYRQHQIIVVPSQFEEPFGLVLVEGMASGLAAAATRRGGLPEVGGDAVDYFDDPDQLADILARLITDPVERSRRGRQARRRALELTWTKTFSHLKTVIGPA